MDYKARLKLLLQQLWPFPASGNPKLVDAIFDIARDSLIDGAEEVTLYRGDDNSLVTRDRRKHGVIYEPLAFLHLPEDD